MDSCPECGEPEKYNSVTCSNCQYVFRYDDRASYEPADIVFTVTFQCRNCNRIFKRGFGEGDEVRPKNSGKPGFSINSVMGNPFLAIVDSERCRPQCPTCSNDTTLSVRDRTPLRAR